MYIGWGDIVWSRIILCESTFDISILIYESRYLYKPYLTGNPILVASCGNIIYTLKSIPKYVCIG